MVERKYQYTIAELIDRLSISLMKSIFIDREPYRAEMRLIMDDIASCLNDSKIAATPEGHVQLLYDCLVLMLSNHFIWVNEGKARAGGKGKASLLRLTHSVNGCRNRAKNEISKHFGERTDKKIDCLAADLPKEYGNWDVFDANHL